MSFHSLFTVLSFFIFPSLALSQSNWELQKNKDGIKIWTADTPDSDFKTFKAEMIVDAKLENVKNLLVDLDAITTYYVGIENVTDIERPHDNEAVYYLEFDFPWPVSKRRARVKSKAVPVEIGSYEITTTLVPPVNEKKGFIPVQAMSSMWIIINAGNGKTFVKHIAHMDPSGSVPAWIANSQVTETPFKSLQQLRSILEKE